MDESTAGTGLNAVGGTSKRFSTLNRYCSITESRPRASSPAAAAIRSTTSFCSMKVMSLIRSSYSHRRNKIGVEMLYGKLPTTRSGDGSVEKSNSIASA